MLYLAQYCVGLGIVVLSAHVHVNYVDFGGLRFEKTGREKLWLAMHYYSTSCKQNFDEILVAEMQFNNLSFFVCFLFCL